MSNGEKQVSGLTALADRIEEAGSVIPLYIDKSAASAIRAAIAAPVAAALPASNDLVTAARNVLSTELGEMACTGSMAPCEDALGKLADALAATPALPAEKVQGMTEGLEEAPPNSLPNWSECSLIIENHEFRKRASAGLEGPTLDLPPTTPEPTALHRFIYEYDDADSYRSAWFMHRLELALAASGGVPALALPVVPEGWKLVPIEPTEKMICMGIEAFDGKCEESYVAMVLAATELPEGNQQPQSWKEFHSALCECSELLGMDEGALLVDVPKVLAERLAAPSHAASTEPVAWQWRRGSEPWSIERTVIGSVFAALSNMTTVRPLYAHPAVHPLPIGYAPDAELAKLADRRYAGIGMMVSKEPGTGRTAIYTEPVAAQPTEQDAARLDFLIVEECRVQRISGKYRVQWPDDECGMPDFHADPRPAIDAAILANQSQKG